MKALAPMEASEDNLLCIQTIRKGGGLTNREPPELPFTEHLTSKVDEMKKLRTTNRYDIYLKKF